MALASASQAQTVKKATSEPLVNHERDPHIFIKIQERAYSLFQATGFRHGHDFEHTGWKRKTGRRLFGCESDSIGGARGGTGRLVQTTRQCPSVNTTSVALVGAQARITCSIAPNSVTSHTHFSRRRPEIRCDFIVSSSSALACLT